jgi:tungstate transport system substrate-binding protein
MRNGRRIGSFVLVAMLLIVAACRRADEQAAVTIATTPDLAGNGVVEPLARTFSAASKVRTHILVTEERFIPGLVRDGVVDVVFTSSPALQQELRRGSLVRLANVVAYDDYLLAGPSRDPAKAKQAKTAAEALRRIARRDRAFCSPVDVPDLRHREAQLWTASPASASDDRRYRLCHGTALEVLREASRRSAYTITDRSTFEAAGTTSKLVPILQHTPLLHHHVEVLLARGERPHRNAEWFVQWVMSHRGRDIIERHRFEGGRRWFVTER